MAWRLEYSSHCRLCGEPRGPDERFTARGKHLQCSDAKARAAATDLHLHQGEFFEKWRRGMAASVGVILPDEPSEQT